MPFNFELYIPYKPKGMRDSRGRLLKGNTLAKGNTWDKVYDEETAKRQRERAADMCRNLPRDRPRRHRKVICEGVIYNSIADASRELFGSAVYVSIISKCCRGLRKRVKGKTFEYFYESDEL